MPRAEDQRTGTEASKSRRRDGTRLGEDLSRPYGLVFVAAMGRMDPVHTVFQGLRAVLRPMLAVVAAGLLGSSGCASVPYRYGTAPAKPPTCILRPGEAQIERGRPVKLLDDIGWLVGIPSKILLLDSRVDNHRLSPETEAALASYLARNDLTAVKIRLNEYAPGAEWSRLFRNRDVGLGWRLTLGLIATAFYTVLPGRVFGGDHYNPFTDTISLYSDHPAIALHEASHAKDFAGRTWKGSYGALRILPIVPLHQEGIATGDAIGYLRVEEEPDEERAAYKILYPAYGTYIGGEYVRWVPGAQWVIYAAVVPGHIVGRIKAAHVRDPAAPAPCLAP